MLLPFAVPKRYVFQDKVTFIKTSFYSAAKLTILHFMAKQKVLFVIKLNFT